MNRIVRISANILKMFAGEILVKKKKKPGDYYEIIDSCNSNRCFDTSFG